MSDELKFLSQRVVIGKLSRRDFLGRAAALGISTTSAISLLANAALAASPRRGGTLKAGMQGGESTNSLDPASWQSQVPYTFGRQWGEQLVQLSPEGDAQPALAEEWSASNDAKVWTFKIRKGVLFHNGKEMTPADVLATLERHSDTESQSGALGILSDIDKIRVVGGNVVIHLKESNADLPYLLEDYHLMIQPNGGKDDPNRGIGTGPYKITVNEPGIRHVGERFSNYWRDDRGFADRIEVIVINDATARISALQGRQVDMVNRVDPKIVKFMHRVSGVTIRNVVSKGHYAFLAHCNTAPFDNNDLRLALKYALDREEMLQKILQGHGSVGNDTPINSVYPLFAEIAQREFDPEKAAFHYRKSRHSGPILLRASDVAFPGAVDAAQLYQQSAVKAGITIKVKREPGDGYWSEVWNRQPFSASYWGGRPTQDQVYTMCYYSKAVWNDTRFQREDFDKMLFAARSTLDKDKRVAIYKSMSELLRDQGGVINPMFNNFIDATGPRVGGWVRDGNQELMGGYALSKCWVNG